MTGQHELWQNFRFSTLVKPAVRGAGIALVLVTGFLIFLSIATEGSPGFGLWALLPMLTTTIGGTFGGMFYFLADRLLFRGGWQKTVVNILSVLAYVVISWVSLVAGLSVVGLWD